MKGGTAVATSLTKHTEGVSIRKPTAEQIRYAQLLNTEDSKVLNDKIRQVADVTGYSQDEVSIALHDCNFDTEATINALLEGRQDQSEWVMRTNRKKKHQSSVTQGIDSIIPTSPSTQNTAAPAKPGGTRPPRSKGRNRQSGENNASETNQKSEGGVNNNNGRDVIEGGRGRGSREDKWNDRKPPGGRGGPPRRGGRGGGRPGRSFHARARDRSNRLGGGNRSDRNTGTVNGPTVNGTELWDAEDDVTKNQKSEDVSDSVLPVTEEWETEDWGSVSQPAVSATSDSLFNSAVSSAHSWPSGSDNTVPSWEVESQTVSSSSVAPVSNMDSISKGPDTSPHFTPESVDMAVIHSKLAQNQSMSKDQFPGVDFQIPYIPLPGELHGTSNHNDSLSKLLDKVGLSSVGLPDQDSMAAPMQVQPQRQQRPPRAKKSQKSQIPLQAVEMPGSMSDNLDVQFGNLEFGGDSVSSPRKKEESSRSLAQVEDTRPQEKSHDEPSQPVEPKHEQATSLPSPLPMSTPVTIATATSSSPSMTALEESSSRHFQHPSPRNQKQPLVTQVSKPIQPEPIPLPPQLESRESHITSKPPLAAAEPQKVTPSLQPASIPSSSLTGPSHNQTISSSPLRPAMSTAIPKDMSLETRAYQHHHVSQPLVPTTKEKFVSSSLGGSGVSSSDLSSSEEPFHPPPGVSLPHTGANQTTITTSSSFTTVTMSNTGKPLSHTTKPSLPPGVLPVNTLYGMQQGLIHAYPLPYSYEDLQRLPMSPYYDLPAFQAATRDGLSTTFHGDQKYGRTDTSSPVPTSLTQGGSLPQPHLQQQAFINATTMPHPYGYGGLAFYPGASMVPGGFPAYTTPMYQMPTKTHGNASGFQSPYNSGQHGSHNFASGYDDLGQAHDFGKSGYHTSVSPSQSKSNAGVVVSTASELSGAPFKPPGGKFNDSKAFLGGTPPPAMNLSMTGQHGPLGSYHTGHPYMSMVPPIQQHHPPSHYHQHHHLAHHMDTGQPVTSQRGAQGQGPKQGQNKGHQSVGYQASFWSGTN